MKRLNLATWQILVLLEYSGLVNWNSRQFIFNAIIPGYMEKKIIKSSVSPSLWAIYFWGLNTLLPMNYAVPTVFLG